MLSFLLLTGCIFVADPLALAPAGLMAVDRAVGLPACADAGDGWASAAETGTRAGEGVGSCFAEALTEGSCGAGNDDASSADKDCGAGDNDMTC